MLKNPLETNPDREQRVRECAYHLWEVDGKPHGRDVEYWERARELVAIEERKAAGKLPDPPEPHATGAEVAATPAQTTELTTDPKTGDARTADPRTGDPRTEDPKTAQRAPAMKAAVQAAAAGTAQPVPPMRAAQQPPAVESAQPAPPAKRAPRRRPKKPT
jgi:Protein of unknown function (DUF2934)